MTSFERPIDSTDQLPYELMAEQVAKERMEAIKHTYGTDPHIIMANLPAILHEYGHDCMELGANLVSEFPHVGAADMMSAYSAGVSINHMETGE
jgi:hypothetical protein